jgi:hypothetical protein
MAMITASGISPAVVAPVRIWAWAAAVTGGAASRRAGAGARVDGHAPPGG